MLHSTESHCRPCNCRSVGECFHNLNAETDALDALVDDFAAALKQKLRDKRCRGKSGWDDPAWPREDILRQLREHIDKGDMVDVAAFAAFAWNRVQPDPSPAVRRDSPDLGLLDAETA